MLKQYKVSDVLGPSFLGKYHNPKNLIKNNRGFPYICASNSNNGINKNMPRVEGTNLALTPPKIISWGKQCPFFCYHDEPCVTGQGMYYFEVTHLDEKAALYLCSALQKAIGNNYGYSNCLIGSKANDLFIALPSRHPVDWKLLEVLIGGGY